MCRGISVEIGLADQVVCWFGDPDETGPDRDSHTKIREFHGVREATTMASDRKRAPAEWICHGNIENAADYRLVWDEAKPEWWDDDRHMPQARAKLASEITRRVKHAKETGVWPGSLTLRGVVSLPDYIASVGGRLGLEGATVPASAFPALVSIGDWLDLSGATVPEHAFPVLASIGDWLDLKGATVPASAFPALASVGGLDLKGATVPEHAFPVLATIGDWLDLSGATVPEHAFPVLASIGGGLYLKGATVPEHAFPALATIGDWLYLKGATVPESVRSRLEAART